MMAHRPLRLLFCVSVCAYLAACAHPVFKMQPLDPPAPPPIWSGEPSALATDEYFTEDNLLKKFAFESARERPPGAQASRDELYRDGLALSGGGARAASYAMGVLEGLHANGVLQQKFEAVSTVSGGGYAAYWYYSRLSDTYLGNQVFRIPDSGAETSTGRALDVFAECLPTQYAGLLPQPGEAEPPGVEALRAACPAGDPRWISPGDEDIWRFQNHLRGFSDILSNDFEIGLDRSALDADVFKALGLTLVTFPVHAVANLLFDWRLQISPSQRQYALGIERTYGLPPVDLKDGSGGCSEDMIADEPDHCAKVRPVPNRLVGRGLTFATLQLARKRQQYEWDNRAQQEKPRIPLLIVNTTAGVSRTWFDWLEEALPDFEDSVFEFTPAAFGSRLYGYWPGSHPEVDVAAAVSASAAFFDSQQRTMRWPARAAVGSLFRLFQLEWGRDIANPWQPDRMRGRHAAFPFPFYFAHGFTKNPSSPYIHLSDGGQSDNTGVFALVRRGVRRIVFADAGQDVEGLFKDLCTLRRQLSRKNLHLFMPSLSSDSHDFAAECDQAGSDRRATTSPPSPTRIWSMTSPVLRGCITRDAGNSACNEAAESSGRYYANLYVLKPSLNFEALREPLEQCRASLGEPRPEDAAGGLGTRQCRQAYWTAVARQPRLPRELFGFLVRNWDAKDAHPIFPQHSTWKITLNSSSTLFGAYKALGRWHAEQLLLGNKELCVTQEYAYVGPLKDKICRSAGGE